MTESRFIFSISFQNFPLCKQTHQSEVYKIYFFFFLNFFNLILFFLKRLQKTNVNDNTSLKFTIYFINLWEKEPGEYQIIWDFSGGNTEEAEVEWFSEDLQDLLELTPKKDVLFITRDWNGKVGSQETPGVTGKFDLGVQNEAGQRLREFCQENSLVIANTLFQQHKRRLYTWPSPDGQHRNQIDYILHRQTWRSSIQSAKTRLGADCASDH